VDFVRIPSVPPILIILDFVVVEIFGKGSGELVGMYLGGKVRKRKSVREKPTIRHKLGFKLIRIP
jgi:hypothetical protein